MRKNDGQFEDTYILLPLPPLEPAEMDAKYEMEIYVRFMRCLRNMSTQPRETAILTSLHFVADMMEMPVTDIVETLVDLGLRAPRTAFPESYVRLIDQQTMQDIYDVRNAHFPLRDLRHHWQAIWDDKFATSGLSN